MIDNNERDRERGREGKKVINGGKGFKEERRDQRMDVGWWKRRLR